MSRIAADRQQHLKSLADRLAQAWRSNTVITSLTKNEIPLSRQEAYFVQDEMAQALAEAVTGWKVGATSTKMRELDGHDDVIPGRIFQSTTYISSEITLPSSQYPSARVETEFAYRLSKDIAVRSEPWQVDKLAPIATLHPAVEIIGNRYPQGENAPIVGTLLTIADNGGGIGFVFGEPVAKDHEFDLQNHAIQLCVDDKPAVENFLGEMRCVPLQAFTDLVNHLATRNIGLKAGDFVSTGAATVPQAINRGSRVVADFGSFGSITLTFE